MVEPGETTASEPPVATTTAVGTTTREQHRRNGEEHATIEDGDKSTTPDGQKKKPTESVFKGSIHKMGGNVFQMSEEANRANQFSHTMEALRSYAIIELTHAGDLTPLFKDPCEDAIIPVPADTPPLLADKTIVTREHRLHISWKSECEQYNIRVAALATNKLQLFTVIIGQCSQSVKLKVEGTPGYKTAFTGSNCKWLLTAIKNICHNFEHTENRFVALVNAKAALFNLRQGGTQSTTDYFETFKELLSVLESYKGKLHDPADGAPESAENDLRKLTVAEKDAYMRDRYCAVLFLRNADGGRFHQLKSDLSNDFIKGRDEFPASLSDAHQLLLTYKGSPKKASAVPNNRPKPDGGRGDGAQGGGGRGYLGKNPQPGRGTPPAGRTAGRTFVQVGFCLAQVENHFPNGIPTHFILLDSDSTVSIFCNPNFLSDIHDVPSPLCLETNGGGRQITSQMGTVAGFGEVWYNPESIANVLSLAQVRRVRRVTMDSSEQAAFIVHKPDGEGTTIFFEHESGLYLHDASAVKPIESGRNDTNNSSSAYSCLQTVSENKQAFTKRQVDAADAARALYRMIGRPSHERFINAIKNNHILNCPITVDDVTRAEIIYGKDVAFLKGKTTARPAKDHVPSVPLVALPPDILSLHPHVTLCMDLFFVLGNVFSLSTSRNLHFLSCRALSDRTKSSLSKSIADDIHLYNSRGFTVTEIHGDGEYSPYREQFTNVKFSICSVDDHVPEIERAIRTVKETIRSTVHGMPYKRLPRVMLRELVTMAVRTLNMLPHSDGVSTTMSPATIVTGTGKTDYRTMTLEFGSYVQVYDGTSNDTKSRTLGAIALNPTGNSSGDYYFLSLTTGHRIHRRSWTLLPISESAISRVDAIAFDEGMPLLDSDVMVNEYDPDALVDESFYDKDYVPPAPDPIDDHHLSTDAYSSESDADSDDDESLHETGHHPDFDDESPTSPDPIPTTVAQSTVVATPIISQPLTTVLENEERDTPVPANTPTRVHRDRTKVTNTRVTDKQKRAIEEGEREALPLSLRPGLRSTHSPNFQHRYGFSQVGRTSIPLPDSESSSAAPSDNSIRKAIFGLMFTQMSAHKGIKKHGQTALNALKKEFVQFRTLEVLEPLDAFALTDEQKAESLRALSVIKEKRDGSLKGRTCADGSTQQGKYEKSQTGSPTIANDALFMTVMIDAFEKRDVATADVTGAYLHAHMKDFISMRFTGWAVDLLCEVNPEYSQYAVYEGKVKVLYVRCNKAIYGCVVSGMLWYELFSETLEKLGFVVNPYDFCVANATFEGTQCTIGWFVDDTKISHINPAVVTKIVDALEDRFGKMSVTRGTTHQFLGMEISYPGDGTASIHMPSYIQGAIDESGLCISKSAPSPCASSLLKINSESPILPAGRAKVFHCVVAKLIYVGTRARTDILLTLGFLCGRVSVPTEQDELKLRRLLEYLYGTIDMKMRLGADSLNHFTTWVDASFAIHEDMRSHTGGVVSFGRGGLICKSKKQNINTKSSTEAELIGASDYLPNTLYVKMFMEAQGHKIEQAVFFQDNESAIKMEQNGKASCGQRSRHIDIRYFFITDHSKRQSISITHCPTTDMLADFFTKPLQGSLFKKFRSVLLGEAHISSLTPSPTPSGNEERVGYKNPDKVKATDGSYPVTTVGGSAVNASHSIEKYPKD